MESPSVYPCKYGGVLGSGGKREAGGYGSLWGCWVRGVGLGVWGCNREDGSLAGYCFCYRDTVFVTGILNGGI